MMIMRKAPDKETMYIHVEHIQCLACHVCIPYITVVGLVIPYWRTKRNVTKKYNNFASIYVYEKTVLYAVSTAGQHSTESNTYTVLLLTNFPTFYNFLKFPFFLYFITDIRRRPPRIAPNVPRRREPCQRVSANTDIKHAARWVIGRIGQDRVSERYRTAGQRAFAAFAARW